MRLGIFFEEDNQLPCKMSLAGDLKKELENHLLAMIRK
jgi:hypothetical protein